MLKCVLVVWVSRKIYELGRPKQCKSMKYKDNLFNGQQGFGTSLSTHANATIALTMLPDLVNNMKIVSEVSARRQEQRE